MQDITITLKNIDRLQKLMHTEAKDKGINHENVIKISQMLDKQIVLFYKQVTN